MRIKDELLKDETGLKVASVEPVWSLREQSQEIYDALAKTEPALGDVYGLLDGELPVQKQWAFGDYGPVSRPDRHVRAFYLDLGKLTSVSDGRGFIAIKGTEPVSENFASIAKRMGEMWNVFSWTIGGQARPVLEDLSLMNQLERFPISEGKPPGVHPLWDADDEARCALQLQTAYYRRFGRLARIPTPLFVYRWPEAVREQALDVLRPLLSPRTAILVEAMIRDELGAYVYHYPAYPMRAMHVRGGDVGVEVPYDKRHAALRELTDPDTAIERWIRLTAEFLALGWIPTDPAHFGRGNCLMAQNLVLDGGIVDVNSIRHVSTMRAPGELDFAVRQSVRELTQSISWFLVGTEAGVPWFQRIFVDAFAHVWDALRRELAELDAPQEIQAVFSTRDGTYRSLDRLFRNYFGLSAYRPQDAEAREYRQPAQRGA
ncbi:hypothetical protein [Burkholderia stagnalis]|uniref:Uncharacterized protein n=1 Tax=Burkholderia stagnalis TaxID=1503054 RepID=A0ABX9YQ42_9BURK|nr:hypothetical protein [Burkholderia stagnalis]RQQ61473.1 hypothetical protein DF158_10875 [Burkholderia stagnalis]RQQ71534.1 hypothetical protein DF137_09185 [Burkholderia stagnalis]RQQ72850.1 hypothetical protein DF139_08290 [Burkholderia stagnalis]RQQ75760.1 hypothetical protein DF138_31625 [Burkholderia stagnalis]RQQ96491.1 hypothetical protein DF134_03825 [Burkholderia stagnalis]